MVPRGVFVGLEATENRFNVRYLQLHVTAVFVRGDVWRDDLLVEVGVDGVDGAKPSHEHSERVDLRLHSHIIEVALVPPPESEFLEFAAGEFVEVFDILLVTLADEVAKSGPM